MAEHPEQASPAASPEKPKGFKSFLPTVLAMILMPGVAYATLKFVPGIQDLKTQLLAKKADSASGGEDGKTEAGDDANTKGEGKKEEAKSSAHGEHAAPKVPLPSRMPLPLVPGDLAVSQLGSKAVGSAGLVITNAPKMPPFNMVNMAVKLKSGKKPHYLLTQIFIAGENSDKLLEKYNEVHRDLYMSITNHLSTKTIKELNSPGAKNILRSEVMNLCTARIGPDLIQEIIIPVYVTQ